MKEKDNSTENTAPEKDEKIEINKSVFKVNKELRKQREEEQAKKEQEIAEKYAQREKEKKEAYEKKLHDERIELMRLKQGVLDESEATIHEEKEEEVQLSFGKKIANFFYHNKWWVGLGVFFIALGGYLVYDLLSKPNPDMVILMICDNNPVGTSTFLEEYFEEYAEDSNGNGKVLVNVYYIPYGDDDYQNYVNGVQTKITTFLNNADGVMVIGNKKTVDDLLPAEESFVDLSSIYPDDPHVDGYFYYIKDTKFAEHIGVTPDSITEDMFFALRKPKDVLNDSKEKMQETYDKDFPTFDRVVKALSSEE
jgi:galactokinase